MKEYICLLLCAAVAVCTAHNFENCEPLPDPTATHPLNKEVMLAGSLAVYREGDEVVADITCDETRGFFRFPLHSERLRCSYNEIQEVWKWDHVAKGQQIPDIECIYVYPGAVEHVIDFGSEYEGCNTPEGTRDTIEKVQDTLQGSLPCSLNNECVLQRLDCRKTESTTLLTFQVMSRALLDISKQRELVDTAVEFIESFYHPVFNGNKIRRLKRDNTHDADVTCASGHGEIAGTAPNLYLCGTCPMGTFQETGSRQNGGEILTVNVCTPCEIGSYSDSTASTKCTDCGLIRHEYSTLAEGSTSRDQCVAVCDAPDESDAVFAVSNPNIQSFRPLSVLQHDTMVMTCKEGYYYGGESTTTVICDHYNIASNSLPTSCRSMTMKATDKVLWSGDTQQEITCTISGPLSQPSSITWMKDGVEINTIGASGSVYTYHQSQEVHVVTAGSEYNSQLVIVNARDPAQLGDYSCRANFNGERSEDSETISYEVFDEIQTSIDPSSGDNINALQDQEVKVTCSLPALQAYSQREITWFKGSSDTPYKKGIQNSITEDDVYQSVLTIDAVISSDGDSYKCKGTYVSDEDTSDSHESEKAFTLSTAYFESSEDSHVVLAKADVGGRTLHCKIILDSTFDLTVGNNEIQWYKDGNLMSPQPTTFTGQGTTDTPFNKPLTIYFSDVANSGVYQCRVTSGETMNGPSHTVSIHDLGFETEPAAQYVKPGMDATMTCVYKEPTDSSTIVTVMWLDGNDVKVHEVDTSSMDFFSVYYETKTMESKSILTSRSISVADTTKSYKCEVIYEIGDKTLKYTSEAVMFNVRDITIEVDGVEAEHYSGSTAITFTCKYRGYDYRTTENSLTVTPADLTWRSDGVAGSVHEVATVVDADTTAGTILVVTSKYKIDSPSVDHSAKIDCTLFINDNGIIPAGAKTIVKSVNYHYRSVSPSTNGQETTHYSTSPSDSVKCTYVGEDNDDASRVVWYVDGEPVTNAHGNIVISTGVLSASEREDQLTIFGRTPGNDYEIICEYLFSEPEESLDVTQSLKFEGIYQDLNANYFAAEHALVMECVFAGDQTDPTVQWLKNGSPVDLTGSAYTIDNSNAITQNKYSSKLTVDADTDVNGQFKCKFSVGNPGRVYESAGTGSAVKTRSLTISSDPANVESSGAFVYRDTGATLTCLIEHDTGDDPTGVTWYGPDNSPVKQEEYNPDNMGYYTLALNIDDPSGEYKCSFAFEAGGPVESTFDNVRLAKIKMVSPWDIMHAVKGTAQAANFIVKCEVESDSELTDLEMYNGDRVIGVGDRQRVFDPTNKKTTISHTVPVSNELNNLYSCRKSETETSETTEVYVHEIKTGLEEVYFVSAGDVLSLACDAGYRLDVDEPMIEWFYEEVSQGNPTKPNIVTSERVSDSIEIDIGDNVPADTKVKCEFKYTGIDGYGELFSEADVVQKAMTANPATESKYSVGSSAYFTCTLTGPNLNIQWLKGDGTIFDDSDATINPTGPGEEVQEFYDYGDSAAYVKKSVLKLSNLQTEDSDDGITCRAEEGLEQTFSLSVIGFITQPEPTYVIKEDGGTVTITCVVNVGPSEEMPSATKWSYNGQTLVVDDNYYKLTKDDAISSSYTYEETLVVKSDTTDENGGSYECVFTFSVGLLTSTLANVKDRILVKSAPHNNDDIIWHHKPGDLTLSCESYDGSDNPTYSWLDPDNQVISGATSLSYTITNDDAALSGDYTCQATYANPTTVVKQVFNVQMAPIEVSPTSEQYVTDRDGNTATISCSVRSDKEEDLKFVDADNNNSPVGPTDKKYEGGKTKIIYIFDDLDYSVAPAYNYKCRIGDDETTTTTDTATVNVIGAPSSPPDNVFLKDGQAERLECSIKFLVAGITTNPTVEWYKGSELIDSTDAAQTNPDTNDNTYAITTAGYDLMADTDDDRISYKCVFTFPDASDLVEGSSNIWEYSQQLVIIKIEAAESDYFINPNDGEYSSITAVTLSCTLYGSADSAIEWAPVGGFSLPATSAGSYDPVLFSITSTLELTLASTASYRYKCYKTDDNTVTRTIVFENYAFTGTNVKVGGETGKAIDLVCTANGILDALEVIWLDDQDNELKRSPSVSPDMASFVTDTYSITSDTPETKTVTCKLSRSGKSYSGEVDISYKTFGISYKELIYIPYDSDTDGNVDIEVTALEQPVVSAVAKIGDGSYGQLNMITGYDAVSGNWENGKRKTTFRFNTANDDTVTTVKVTVADEADAEYSYVFTFTAVQKDITLSSNPAGFGTIGPDTSALTYTCSASGATSYSWKLGDTDLTSRSDIATVTGGTVSFGANDMLWNNQLTCAATFGGENAYTIEKSKNLNAYGVSMEAITYMDGYTNDAVMTCVVWTDLEPKSVTWTRNADNQLGVQDITDDFMPARYIIGTPETWPTVMENSVGYYTLTVLAMGFGDQYTYNCKATFNDDMSVQPIQESTELKKITAIFDHPSPYYRDNTDAFTLTCIYTGYEDATVEWFEDDMTAGNLISDSLTTTENFVHNRKTSTYAFPTPNVVDSKTYYCRWTMTIDKSYKPTAELDLYINTVAIRTDNDPPVFIDSSAISLLCIVKSASNAFDIKWFHRGIQLVGETSNILDIGIGDTAHPERDNGEYICEVTWSDTGFVMESSITIDIRLASIIDNDNNDLSKIYVNEISPDIIMCKIEAFEAPDSITWDPNSSPKASNTKELENSIVYYSNMTRAAVAETFTTEEVTCDTNYGGGPQGNPSATVTLQYAKATPENECEYINLGTQTALEKILTCNYRGASQNDLPYKFVMPNGDDTGELTTSSFSTTPASGYPEVAGSYTLSAATVEDSGNYECLFDPDDNDSFRVSSRFRVIARGAVLTHNYEYTGAGSTAIELVKGTTAEFTCTVQGGVKSIEWTRTPNGADTPIAFEYTEKSSVMTEDGLFIESMVIEFDVTSAFADPEITDITCIGNYEDAYCNSDSSTNQKFTSNAVPVTLKSDSMVLDLSADTKAFQGHDLVLTCSFPNLLPDDHTYKLSWLYKQNSGDTLEEMIGLGSVYNDDGSKRIDGVIDNTENTQSKITTTLSIENVDADVSGFYMCMIKWGHIFIKSTQTEVRVAYFTQSPSTTIGPAGADFAMNCAVSDHDNLRPDEVNLMYIDGMGSAVKSTGGISSGLVYSNQITFAGTSDAPGRVYYCEALYSNPTTKIVSEQIEVITIKPTVEETEVWGVKGQTATLSCTATGVVLANSDGTPQKDDDGKNIPLIATIRWLKGTDDLPASGSITRDHYIDSNGILHSSAVLTELTSSLDLETFTCEITYAADSNNNVEAGVVESDSITLKVASVTDFEVNTGTYEDSSANTVTKPLIKGDTFTITCTATGNTVPAFTLYSENFEELDPTYYQRTDDLSVTSSGSNVYTAEQIVRAITPNVLKGGETIKCKADFGQTKGFDTREKTGLVTHYDCAEAEYRDFTGDWKSVTPGVDYGFNPGSGEKLYVSTDSTAGSGDMISVKFGYDSTEMTTLSIYFTSPMKFNVKGCSMDDIDRESFDTTPSTQQQKTWVISVGVDRMNILCNGVEVVEYIFDSSYTGSTCRTNVFGSGTITQATFTTSDSATDAYKADDAVDIITPSIDLDNTDSSLYMQYTQTVSCPPNDDTANPPLRYALSPTANGFASAITCSIATGKYDNQLQTCAKLVPFESFTVKNTVAVASGDERYEACSTETGSRYSTDKVISRLEGTDSNFDNCPVNGEDIKCLDDSTATPDCSIPNNGISCTWDSTENEYTVSVKVVFNNPVWDISTIRDYTSWPYFDTDGVRFPISDASCQAQSKKKRSVDELEVVNYSRNSTITAGENGDQVFTKETLHITYQWLVAASVVGVAVVAALLLIIKRSQNMHTSKKDVESLLS